MRTGLFIMATAALLVASAFADETTDMEVGELSNAVDARIAALTPPADKLEKKEGKKLSSGAKKLAKYTDTTDKKSLKNLGKGLLLIVKSKTADATTLAELDEVVAALIALAKQDAAAVQALQDALESDKFRAKAAKKLGAAQNALTNAETLAQSDLGKGGKAVVGAILKFAKAEAATEKLADKELANIKIGPLPEGLVPVGEPFNGSIENQTGETIEIIEVTVDLKLKIDGRTVFNKKGIKNSETAGKFDIDFPFPLQHRVGFWSPIAHIDFGDIGTGTTFEYTGTAVWQTSVGNFVTDLARSVIR